MEVLILTVLQSRWQDECHLEGGVGGGICSLIVAARW